MKNLQFRPLSIRRLVLLSLALGTSLGAGIRYEMNLTNFTKPSEADGGSVTIWVDDGKMKVQGAGSDSGEMVFNLAKKEMLLIDHQEKSYIILDEQAVEKISSQISSAMAEYERALENVPPQQRKMMENMLKKQMPQGSSKASPVETKLQATGATEIVNGYKARVHEVYTNGKKTQELFVTRWDNIKGNEALIDVFEGMGGFFKKMTDAFAQGPLADRIPMAAQGNWLEQVNQLNGFPVLVREFGPTGEPTKETRLTKAEEASFEAAIFQAPSGYKRRSLDLD